VNYVCKAARFEVFTAMKILVVVFWVVTPCCHVAGYLRFRGPLWRWKQHDPPKRWYLTTSLYLTHYYCGLDDRIL